MEDDVFGGIGVEISIDNPDDFLKVRETLTRIGIASSSQNKLYQSCHILHKRGRYAIVHFKEMFLLDGKTADLTEEDVGRRNTIAGLLDEWGLINVLDYDTIQHPTVPISKIRIVKYSDKNAWELVPKYNIGRG